MCSTTAAVTVAFAIVGEPTATLPSELIINTRSNVTGLPASMSRRSISSVSPATTRYCLLPVSTTAYIKRFRQRDGDETKNRIQCQRLILLWKLWVSMGSGAVSRVQFQVFSEPKPLKTEHLKLE